MSNLLFYEVEGATGIHPVLALLLVGEVALPGAAISWLSRLACKSVHGLWHLDLRPRIKMVPAQAGLLVLCLAGAGVAWVQVFRGVYALDASEMLGFAGVLARLFAVPSMIFVMIVRSRLFRRLDSGFDREQVFPDDPTVADVRPEREDLPGIEAYRCKP